MNGPKVDPLMSFEGGFYERAGSARTPSSEGVGCGCNPCSLIALTE
jgi:hypothetical protein